MGFHLIRRLTELTQELGTGDVRIVYLMTDVVPANIEYWRHHPRLQPYVDAGLLAYGRYDVLGDQNVQLVTDGTGEGEVVSFAEPAGGHRQPLLTVAAGHLPGRRWQLQATTVTQTFSRSGRMVADHSRRATGGDVSPAVTTEYGDAKARRSG